MTELAIVIPVTRTEFIERCLDTLYKHTPGDFRVFVIDHSVDGIDDSLRKKYVHWYVRPYHNLGFAKSVNELMWTAYRQGYPYIAAVNDDVEYMHTDWFEGIKEEFASDEKIMAACPESPKIAMWGYGMTDGEFVELVPYKKEYSNEDIEYLKKGDYDEAEIRSRHEFEIPDSFPFTKRGVVDAIAMWHPVFKREALEKIGYFDERFLYGGGEDYDLNARAYRQGYRMVSTMKSWVWHHWGQTIRKLDELPPELFEREPWNDLDSLWPPELNFGKSVDPWGKVENPSTGQKVPFKRVPEVKIDPL